MSTQPKMRAVCFDEYGPPEVLKLRRIDRPQPTADQLCIRIHAATVTPGDCELRRFDFPKWIWLPLRLYMGIRRPRWPLLGMEFSGVVESVGARVDQFQPGDEVFGPAAEPFGTYAEYRCQRQKAPLAIKPPGISHADAATISVGAVNALHYLRKGEVKPGDRVLINGAAGCFGSYAVQLAKIFGAEVTGVDHTDKIAALRALGADHVIDYTREDFTKNGQRYDVIFEVTGKMPFARSLRSLDSGGRLVLANPRFFQMFQAPLASRLTDKKATFAFANENRQNLEYLAGLMNDGRLKAWIDRRYPLEQVAEAHRYVEAGPKIGHVVIDVASSSVG